MQVINSSKTLRCHLSLVHTAEDQRTGVGVSLLGMTAPWKAGSVRLAQTTPLVTLQALYCLLTLSDFAQFRSLRIIPEAEVSP